MLLACRQWDPLELARRPPSLRVGAWRSAPLLPWRVQCPVRVCTALAAGSGGFGRYLVLCLSRFPLPATRVPRCVWRAILSGCPLPSLAGTPFHAVCAFCEFGLVALLVVPARPSACVCARAPAASAPPPLGGVACAPRVVSALGAGRAVPRGPCPSACPAPVPCSVWRAWGGAVRSPFPPTWLRVVGVAEGRPRGGCLRLLRGASGVRRSPSSDRPPTGRAVGIRYPRAVGAGLWVWGPYTVPLACTPCGGCVPRGSWGAVPLPGLGLCAPRGAGPWRSCAGGRAVGRGVALPRSVPLPSLGRQQSGCHWRCSVHGGCGPPYHSCWCSPSLGAICAASWRVDAGSLVPRGSCGSLRLGRRGGPRSGSSLGRGEGGPSPLPRGVGAGAFAACGPVGGWGEGRGVAPRPPCPPSVWRPAVPYPGPPLVVGPLPPGVRVQSGSSGRPGVAGDEGRPVDRFPGGPFRPEPPLCPPWVGSGHGGVMRGRGLHTVLVRRRAPPPGLVRAPLWCAGVGSPVGRDPRRSRRLGALGRAVCRSSRSPPPPRRGPFWGRGGAPSAPGGQRVAPVALKLGGGERGGGWGGRPPAPSAPSGVGLPSVVSGVPPRGILVPWRLPGGRGRRARSGRPAMGQCGGGGGGRGGGNPPALVRAPVFPGPACEGVAPFAPSWAPPVRRRLAAGRACGRLPRPWCPLTPGAAASSGGAAGPPSLRSASVRSWV